MSLSASKGKQPGHGTKLPAAHSAQKGPSKEKRYQPLPSSSLTASEAHESCKLFFLKLHVLNMETNALIAWYKRHRYQTAIAVGAAGSDQRCRGSGTRW